MKNTFSAEILNTASTRSYYKCSHISRSLDSIVVHCKCVRIAVNLAVLYQFSLSTTFFKQGFVFLVCQLACYILMETCVFIVEWG